MLNLLDLVKFTALLEAGNTAKMLETLRFSDSAKDIKNILRLDVELRRWCRHRIEAIISKGLDGEDTFILRSILDF
jgi:hypothetical protein